MLLRIAGTFLLFVCLKTAYAQQNEKPLPSQPLLLPNGWKLSPAGKALPLGDLPLNMQVSVSGRLIAVTNNGESNQSIQLIDARRKILLDEKVIPKSWYGLAFSSDEKMLYASGGNDNTIVAYPIISSRLGKADTIHLGAPWPNKIGPAGIALNKLGTLLYTVTKEDSSIYTIDLKRRDILSRVHLPSEAYGCVLSPDESTLYVSLWGFESVAVYETRHAKIRDFITVQSHPNEMLLNKKGTLLYVANANDNSVSVISTKTGKVLETLNTALYPTHLTGSGTNGLALAEGDKTLFVANADNNCLAVFDVGQQGRSHSMGFIPVGWYPTSVRVTGNSIWVTNGKGLGSMANPLGPQPMLKKDNSGYYTGAINSEEQYIGGLFKGALSIIAKPTTQALKRYTAQVYENTPFTARKIVEAEGRAGSPIPRHKGDSTPIKHVFYIIKENRTYDQVMGDIAEGNGDSSLCIFGRSASPNHHALAREFVLLDNFYVDAEVSADGHNWSNAAYATDYTEKTWPTSYGGRGGTHDYEGSRSIAFPKNGYIWDYCKRAGVSYRTYGEFGAYGHANIACLEGHVAPHTPGFDLSIQDQVRVDTWIADFDSLLAIGAVPQFNSIRISNDHTSGQRLGKPTPLASMADNDLAIGRFVEHLSKSPIWKESAVFILEDDAQNGPDHVDAHRSVALLAGPYVKRGAVIHDMYSTSGVLRTMELILGLPPMSQYDAAALPLFNCFTNNPDMATYEVKPAQISLEEKNMAVNESSRRSEKLLLAKEDQAPDRELNDVIWKAIKGENSKMPVPVRSAFVILEKGGKDDH
jgi:YVTN family beta-propeller protein